MLIVIIGREACMKPTLQYALTQLASVMPKSFIGNVAVLFSNTESKRSLNFDANHMKSIGLKQPPCFNLENPLCEVQRFSEDGEPIDDDLQTTWPLSLGKLPNQSPTRWIEARDF